MRYAVIAIHAISMLVFFPFILAPVFGKKKEEAVTLTAGESLSKQDWEEWE